MKMFEVGKTYLYGDVRAKVVKRSPKFVTIDIDGKTFKCRCKPSDSAEGYTMEEITLPNFPSLKERAIFWADCLDVEKVTISPNIAKPEKVTVQPAIVQNFDADNPHEIKRYNFTVPDLYTAILLIESNLGTFTIKHEIKGQRAEFCDCYYAENCVGDSMEVHDNFVRVEVKRGSEHSITTFWLDIPEKNFVAEMNRQTLKAQADFCDLTKFEMVGDSGTIYTYDERTLQVISTVTPPDVTVEKDVEVFENVVEAPKVEDVKTYTVTDWIISTRRTKQYQEMRVAVGGNNNAAQVVTFMSNSPFTRITTFTEYTVPNDPTSIIGVKFGVYTDFEDESLTLYIKEDNDANAPLNAIYYEFPDSFLYSFFAFK